MYPIAIKLLSDNESLLEYEQYANTKDYIISFDHVKRRLISIERMSDIKKNDNFYEDMGQIQMDKYKSLAHFLYKMPQHISNDLLCNIGNCIYIKKEGFNVWMDILTYIPPTILIAGYIYGNMEYSLSTMSLKGLKSLIEKRISQFKYTSYPVVYLPELNFLTKEVGLHDLHIHLNGSTESDIVWNYMLKHPYRTIRNYADEFNNKHSVRKLAEQTTLNFTPERFGKRLLEAKKIRSYICKVISNKINGVDGGDIADDYSVINIWGMDKTKSFSPIIDEILFYLYVFDYLSRYENDFIACKFHHYLLIKGIIHRLSVMQCSQYGFTQFQYITETPSRYGVETSYKNRFLQLSGAGDNKYLSFIEGRFSPGKNKFEINNLVRRIYKGFNEAKVETDSRLLDDVELYLVAHFIKKKEKKNVKNLPVRHRDLRTDLRKRALALVQYIMTNNEYGSKIKGIDAAASEFDAGPEVFAPIFRFLRKNGIANCTFHAGEDFKHIVSGIRSIYEAVLFLELRHGDRLGHCTAIGIEPQLWMDKTGCKCIISQGEWLDDMVFLWFLIKETKESRLQQCVPLLESQISEFSHKVYGKIFPPYILSEAWKLRKFDPFLYMEEKNFSDFNPFIIESYEKDKEIRQMFENEDMNEIMKIYHRISFNANDEYDKLIEIESGRILNPNEICIVQGIVLDFLNKKGIAIETLPTSNLRISYYDEIREYHLKNWLNNTLSHCTPPVVLGTDDPGIFSTNIFNEYARAYLHLEENKLSSHEIYNMMSFIHRNSIIYKFSGND